MARDYKHRLQQAERESRRRKRPPVAGWQWALAAAAVTGFVFFLLNLRDKAPANPSAPLAAAPAQGRTQPPTAQQAKASAGTNAARITAVPTQTPQAQAQAPAATVPSALPAPTLAKEKEAEKVKPKPRFQFYTVLEGKEVIVTETEVKARKQEEKMGTAPKGDVYVLQIGSFKTYPEADRLRAQVALVGVEAKIETAQIGTATWNRVKVGPYASMSSVDKTRALLRQHNIDSVVQKATAPATGR